MTQIRSNWIHNTRNTIDHIITYSKIFCKFRLLPFNTKTYWISRVMQNSLNLWNLKFEALVNFSHFVRFIRIYVGNFIEYGNQWHGKMNIIKIRWHTEFTASGGLGAFDIDEVSTEIRTLTERIILRIRILRCPYNNRVFFIEILLCYNVMIFYHYILIKSRPHSPENSLS